MKATILRRAAITAALTFLANGQDHTKPGDIGFPAASPAQSLMPVGWRTGGPPDSSPEDYEMGVDRTEKHAGNVSAYIARNSVGSTGFATLAQGIRAEAYRGKRIRYRLF